MAGTLVANTINTDTGLFSTNNAYSGIAKAWVNFAGASGTVNGSFNVSSVTRNSIGDYSINFTTAMPNANYAVSGMGVDYSFGGVFVISSNAGSQTTALIRVLTLQKGNAYYDPTIMTVTVNGA